MSVDRRWRLKVANSFGRKRRRLSDDVVSRGELGTRDGREETVTGTGTGTVTKTRTATGTRTGMGTGAEVGTRTRTERRVEGRESPGTYEVIV